MLAMGGGFETIPAVMQGHFGNPEISSPPGRPTAVKYHPGASVPLADPRTPRRIQDLSVTGFEGQGTLQEGPGVDRQRAFRWRRQGRFPKELASRGRAD